MVAIAREVRVRFGREVGPPGELQSRSLDVEAAILRADPQDRGRKTHPAGVESKRLFDGVDALREREKKGDVALAEEDRFRVAGPRSGGQERFSACPDSGRSGIRGATSESRPIGPTSFNAARQIASGRVGAVTVIRLT